MYVVISRFFLLLSSHTICIVCLTLAMCYTDFFFFINLSLVESYLWPYCIHSVMGLNVLFAFITRELA